MKKPWANARVDIVRPPKPSGWPFLEDPRSPPMLEILNLSVEYRHRSGPFAPSVRCEDVADCFELDGDNPYMLVVKNRGERETARYD